ncbi:cytochrome P450 [Paracraurococcus ruber]|uniref:Cytochrome P450 n=1 Tax=Paracraurococcus ruber TaxID=77675 RepID=A0ABS1CZJ0_9PROT|nr:cytochrome P450 [Paracraurococcus ruber]MBK1659437.1 cytochrome P450 [Paracraurococcus ruber]TDG33229.1 cytochrome P450 [Paracraurococcus ruber]
MTPSDALADAFPAAFLPPAPPVPAAAPGILAQLRLFRRNVPATWPRRAYEDAVYQRPFLGRRSLLLNDPAAIRHVLVEATERYRRTPATLRVLGPLLGQGLVLSEGAAWRLQRRTLAPAFAPRAVALLLPHIHAATEDVLGALDARAPVDLLGVTQGLALEIAGRSMVSLGMARWRGRLRTLLDAYGRHAGVHLPDILLPPAVPTPWDLPRRRIGRRWMALVAEIVAARQAEPRADGPRDLLDLVLAARDPETGRAFSPAEVRDQVATLLLAGHETTALALFWCCVLLAQAPGWQDRVAAEAGAAEQPVTRAVIEEAIRLYPPAFTLARLAIEADEVPGARLRRGDVVLIAPWVLHRHRRLWQAPEAFDPRRFLPGAPAPERFAYLPFGAGPRVCIGAQFAMAEAMIALAGLVRRWRVALVTDRPVLPVAVTTTQPDHRPLFRLIPR